MQRNSIHLPGLNGLRAIAALSVVIAHVTLDGVADFGFSNNFDFNMAAYGVTLFFVISGFLITYLLIQEKEHKKTVNIKHFYARRILRIWPIYYFYLIVAFISMFLLGRGKEMQVNEMWYYVFFATNFPFIFHTYIPVLAHYWSIGVEEQFYLFWPWIVRFSKDSLLKMAIFIFVLFLGIKLFFWWKFGLLDYTYRFLNLTRFHCMMVGAIGAILYSQNKSWFIQLFSNKLVQLLSFTIFLLKGFELIYIPSVIVHEVLAFASLSMIIGQITISKRIINLETSIFDFIGKISYGMYVVHPVLIVLLSLIIKPMHIQQGFRHVLSYVSTLAATLFLAWLSYRYFEKPFLNLKNRFAVVKTSNSMIRTDENE